MTPRVYSSVAAFLAHWRALRGASGDVVAARSPQEQELLAGMERVINTLHPRERAALLETTAGSAGAGPEDPAPADPVDPITRDALARRVERAELQLTHRLTAAGWLQS